MTAQQASDLIELLQTFAKRPGLFLGKPDILLATVFLSGFGSALWKAFGIGPALGEQIATDRGWQMPKASGPGIHAQMLERGMSVEQVIAELVAIEIEVIKLSTTA
jgi:hypothetical protein